MCHICRRPLRACFSFSFSANKLDKRFDPLLVSPSWLLTQPLCPRLVWRAREWVQVLLWLCLEGNRLWWVLIMVPFVFPHALPCTTCVTSILGTLRATFSHFSYLFHMNCSHGFLPVVWLIVVWFILDSPFLNLVLRWPSGDYCACCGDSACGRHTGFPVLLLVQEEPEMQERFKRLVAACPCFDFHLSQFLVVAVAAIFSFQVCRNFSREDTIVQHITFFNAPFSTFILSIANELCHREPAGHALSRYSLK